MNLLLLIAIPLLTALAVLFCRNQEQVKWTALTGALAQLVLSVVLLLLYNQERAAGNTMQMLFEESYGLFQNPRINFHFGVDGLSVAMILLTSFVLVAGILVSWNIEKMTKEFYFLLILLALGAYGFFISLDLFILFFFLEVSVIPKYLLIGIWGSGRKEYSANKLALMLMGGSALILVGILLLYFNAGHSFDITELSQINLGNRLQQIIFPLLFLGFGVFT
ncbi:MAG TPA: proton-conducting transporter membrane subunit, partial [Chitinophagaceae bacterium]|nr:proton-conducting transporter membrane subunit [Chitinophagaceae bacterium]